MLQNTGTKRFSFLARCIHWFIIILYTVEECFGCMIILSKRKKMQR